MLRSWTLSFVSYSQNHGNVSWCLAEGYRYGDQLCPLDHLATEGLYFLLPEKSPYPWTKFGNRLFAVTTSSSITTAVHFNVAAKSRTSAPWRFELVFESPSLSKQSTVLRGRARVDVCHSTLGSRTGCRQWKPVRYRQYDGRGHRYRIYDVTAAVLPLWSSCFPKPCRFHCLCLFLCLIHNFTLCSSVV